MCVFDLPSGQTCGQYLAKLLLTEVGKLQTPAAELSCQYCSVSTADEYLNSSSIFWDERWRNFGLVWAYVVFDITLAVGLYYVFRVIKWNPAAFKRKAA
jgi:ABC-type multidrug transport system permease subunit